MNAIKELPDRAKHIVIGVVAIVGIGLFGLAVYDTVEVNPIPVTIIAPAPDMDKGNV